MKSIIIFSIIILTISCNSSGDKSVSTDAKIENQESANQNPNLETDKTVDNIIEYLKQDDINGFSFNLAYNDMGDAEISTLQSYEAKFSNNLDKFSDHKWLSNEYRLSDTIYNTIFDGDNVKLLYHGVDRGTYKLRLLDFGVLMLKENTKIKENEFNYYVGYLFTSKTKSNLEDGWTLSSDKEAERSILKFLIN